MNQLRLYAVGSRNGICMFHPHAIVNAVSPIDALKIVARRMMKNDVADNFPEDQIWDVALLKTEKDGVVLYSCIGENAILKGQDLLDFIDDDKYKRKVVYWRKAMERIPRGEIH